MRKLTRVLDESIVEQGDSVFVEDGFKFGRFGVQRGGEGYESKESYGDGWDYEQGIW